MIWDFQDGTKYKSAHGINDRGDKTVNEVVQAFIHELPVTEVLARDPVADYERMHWEAAQTLPSPEYVKTSFFNSALRRVQKMGKGVLLQISHDGHELRIVVTRVSISILTLTEEDEPFAGTLAEKIANELGGTACKLVY